MTALTLMATQKIHRKKSAVCTYIKRLSGDVPVKEWNLEGIRESAREEP